MCCLFGMISGREQSARRSLLSAPASIARQSRRCPHGWGLSFTIPDAMDRAREAFFHAKWPEPAAGSPRFAELARQKTHLLVGHVRKRTTGTIDVDHTQPFAQPGLALAHSGGLGREWHRTIIAELDQQRTALETLGVRLRPIKGRTSGERLAAWLALRIRLAAEQTGAAPDIPDATVVELASRLARRTEGIISANFVAGYLGPTGRALYAFRLTPSGKHEGLSYRTQGATVVTSAPTDSALSWQEIPNGTLLIAHLPFGNETRPRVDLVRVV